MYKAEFKTAYLQREVPMNAIVVDDMVRDEMVEAVKLSDDLVVLEKIAAETKSEALSLATHIIAQSDMTLEYGHVPVENLDYAYSNEVISTADMSKLGTTFIGVFSSTSVLPTAEQGAVDGDVALVIDSENKELVKYEASESEPEDESEEAVLSWSKSDGEDAYSIPYSNSKKVALYKIINKYDIIVNDED